MSYTPEQLRKAANTMESDEGIYYSRQWCYDMMRAHASALEDRKALVEALKAVLPLVRIGPNREDFASLTAARALLARLGE